MASHNQHIDRQRYCTVPRTLCFVTRGDDVLLIKGAPHKPVWPNRYNGVGGHVEADEDVFSAAQREIREETGLDVVDLRLRGIANIPVVPGESGVLLLVFTAEAVERRLRPSSEGELVWINRCHLTELDLVEDLIVLLPAILDAPANAMPFFAHYHTDELGQLHIRFAECDNGQPQPPIRHGGML